MPSDEQTDNTLENKADKGTALSAAEISQLAKGFGENLGETERMPFKQIGLMIETCGLPFVEKIMAETEATEAAGGMKTHDRKRRRSKGGVFFFLAKGQMDAKQRSVVFPNFGKHGDGTIAPPGIEWGERIEPMKALREQAGQVSSLTVSLSGRPGKLHIDGSSVMTVIEQRQVKAPPYPKGVPHFDSIDGITTYYVFMSLRHWKRVEKALEDESDLLIVEGSAVYDAQLEGITVLSTRVSTKLQEYKKRKSKSQQEQKPGERPAAKAPAATDDEVNSDRPDLSGMPAEAADKLQKLYSAADKLRQKIDAVDEKSQNSSVKMTRRLLDQTERQIAGLRKQYDR